MGFESLGEMILLFLKGHETIAFFLVLGIGYIIGNLRLGSFSLGSVAGVLFAGLLFGYFGFRINSATQMAGFALFIFSFDYEAGPGFVAILKQDGLKYLILSIVVSITGFTIALFCFLRSAPYSRDALSLI